VLSVEDRNREFLSRGKHFELPRQRLKSEDGRWKMEDGGREMGNGKWKIEDGKVPRLGAKPKSANDVANEANRPGRLLTRPPRRHQTTPYSQPPTPTPTPTPTHNLQRLEPPTWWPTPTSMF
jgi:hypothetical protein